MTPSNVVTKLTIKAALASAALFAAAPPALAQLATGGLQSYDPVTLITNLSVEAQLLATAAIILIVIVLAIRCASDPRLFGGVVAGGVGAMVLVWTLPLLPSWLGISAGRGAGAL